MNNSVHEGVRLAFSPREAAAMTSLSVRTIRKAIADGRLPVARIGRRIVVRREQLEKFLAGDKTPEGEGADVQ